jgi:hypothetical protein
LTRTRAQRTSNESHAGMMRHESELFSGEPLENYDDEIIGDEFRILGTNEHESGNHCLEQHDKVIEGQRQLVFGENLS